MDKEKMPKIQVTCYIVGEKIDMLELSELLNIYPTKIRTKEDWPDVKKNNIGLLKELRPKCVWQYTIYRERCKEVCLLTEELVETLEDKVEKITEFCKLNSSKISFEVVIHMDSMETPYIGLNTRIISFLNSVDAEIDFDIYTY